MTTNNNPVEDGSAYNQATNEHFYNDSIQNNRKIQRDPKTDRVPHSDDGNSSGAPTEQPESLTIEVSAEDEDDDSAMTLEVSDFNQQIAAALGQTQGHGTDRYTIRHLGGAIRVIDDQGNQLSHMETEAAINAMGQQNELMDISDNAQTRATMSEIGIMKETGDCNVSIKTPEYNPLDSSESEYASAWIDQNGQFNGIEPQDDVNEPDCYVQPPSSPEMEDLPTKRARRSRESLKKDVAGLKFSSDIDQNQTQQRAIGDEPAGAHVDLRDAIEYYNQLVEQTPSMQNITDRDKARRQKTFARTLARTGNPLKAMEKTRELHWDCNPEPKPVAETDPFTEWSTDMRLKITGFSTPNNPDHEYQIVYGRCAHPDTDDQSLVTIKVPAKSVGRYDKPMKVGDEVLIEGAALSMNRVNGTTRHVITIRYSTNVQWIEHSNGDYEANTRHTPDKRLLLEKTSNTSGGGDLSMRNGYIPNTAFKKHVTGVPSQSPGS